MNKPVILTGIRSNAELTLGNYLGAMLPFVRMQKKHRDKYQINMFVPDLHSFTTPIEHDSLYDRSIHNLKAMVAVGLDINLDSTYIYRQSYIPAHSELNWILDCFTYVGELKRMTQFKEKSEGKDSVSAGLFNYPVLMAADMLLYDSNYIPLGDDQRQHLELTRDLALRMNHKFNKKLFTVPYEWEEQLKFTNTIQGIRIRSLKQPEVKMSKSIDDPGGTILLSDDPRSAAKKLMSATTDSIGIINYNFETQPGISNLLQILSIINDSPLEKTISEWQGKSSYGELKTAVASSIEVLLTSFQSKIASINDRDILKILEKDELVINKIANTKLALVQKTIGLRP